MTCGMRLVLQLVTKSHGPMASWLVIPFFLQNLSTVLVAVVPGCSVSKLQRDASGGPLSGNEELDDQTMELIHDDMCLR